MGDVSRLELPHQQEKTLISSDPLLDKSRMATEKESNNGPIDREQLDKLLPRWFGTNFHQAFAKAVTEKLLKEAGKPVQPLLFQPPTINDLTWGKANTITELQELISQPLSKFHPDAVTKAVDWINSLHPCKPSKQFRERLTKDAKALFNRTRKEILPIQAILLAGFLEVYPPLNDSNTLVLSEVRLNPPTDDVKRLALGLHAPRKEPLSASDLYLPKKAIPAKENLGLNTNSSLSPYLDQPVPDFLFGVLVNHLNPLEKFSSLIKDSGLTPAAFRHLCLETSESGFIAKLAPLIDRRELDYQQMETLLSLRVLVRAKNQFQFFLGGSTVIKDPIQLKEVLELFPLSENQLGDEQVQVILKKLPKGISKVFAPIFLAADILTLTMPKDGDEKTQGQREKIFRRLKKLCADQYTANSQPALFQYPPFLKLCRKAAKLGMTAALGDIKFTNQPFPQQGVKTEHTKELRVYLNTILQGVSAFFRNKYPKLNFGLRQLIKDPLVKSLKETFIAYFGYRQENYELVPLLALRTAFTEPTQTSASRRPFFDLMDKIKKAMLVRLVTKTSGVLAGEDD